MLMRYQGQVLRLNPGTEVTMPPNCKIVLLNGEVVVHTADESSDVSYVTNVYDRACGPVKEKLLLSDKENVVVEHFADLIEKQPKRNRGGRHIDPNSKYQRTLSASKKFIADYPEGVPRRFLLQYLQSKFPDISHNQIYRYSFTFTAAKHKTGIKYENGMLMLVQ